MANNTEDLEVHIADRLIHELFTQAHDPEKFILVRERNN